LPVVFLAVVFLVGVFLAVGVLAAIRGFALEVLVNMKGTGSSVDERGTETDKTAVAAKP
jgi:hypothetical protein